MYSKKLFKALSLSILIILAVPQGLLSAKKKILISRKGNHAYIDMSISKKGRNIYVAYAKGKSGKSRNVIQIQRFVYKKNKRRIKKKGKPVQFYPGKATNSADLSPGTVIADLDIAFGKVRGLVSFVKYNESGGQDSGGQDTVNYAWVDLDLGPLGNTQLFATTMPGTYIGSTLAVDPALSWTPGSELIIHDVYLGGNTDLAPYTGLFGTNIDVNAIDPNSAHPEQLIPGRIQNVNGKSKVISGWANAGVMVRNQFGDDLAVFSYNENKYDSMGSLMNWGGYAAIEDFGSMLNVDSHGFFVDDPTDTTYTRGVAPLGVHTVAASLYNKQTHQYSLRVLDFNNLDSLGKPTIDIPNTIIDVNDPNVLSNVVPVGVDDYAFSRSTPQAGGLLTGLNRGSGTFLEQPYDKNGNPLGSTRESPHVGDSIREYRACYVDDIRLYAGIEGKLDNNKVFLYWWDRQKENKKQR